MSKNANWLHKHNNKSFTLPKENSYEYVHGKG